MALTDEQIIEAVRNKTTDNEEFLPDDVILSFAGAVDELGVGNLYSDGLDLAGVIADCWEHLDRDDRYNAQSVGNVSAAGPRAWAKAAFYRFQSRKGAAGLGLSQSTLVRTDVTAAPARSATEFGG